jgi:hypothetical protein
MVQYNNEVQVDDGSTTAKYKYMMVQYNSEVQVHDGTVQQRSTSTRWYSNSEVQVHDGTVTAKFTLRQTGLVLLKMHLGEVFIKSVIIQL